MSGLPALARRFGTWPTAIVWAFAIIALSSVPNYFPQSSRGELNFDKVVHFFEYFVLGALVVAAAMRSNTSLPTWIILCVSTAGVATFGASDELYQRMVPGRDTNVYDWAADVTGAVVGAVFGAWLLGGPLRAEDASQTAIMDR